MCLVAGIMVIIQRTFLLVSLFIAFARSDITLQVSDGDVVDCIDIHTQPAFGNELLRNHKLQEWPSEIPRIIDKESKSNWPTWESHVSIAKCPKGTIPVRQNQNTGSNDPNGNASPNHEHAVTSTKTPSKLYGAMTTVNVWQPKLENNDEMSISQIWITSGSWETNDLSTIEVGWQVLPDVYQDHKPRLFIFWTNDSYTTGCYNLQCAGFIQTSNTIILGGVISPVSTYGEKQYELTISVWKDKKYGNWWLSLGPNNSLVGYWPGEILGRLANYADEVQWGGEILNMESLGNHTTTQMGSGHFPNEGFGKSSYFRNLKTVDSNNSFQQVQNMSVIEPNKKFYRVKSMFKDDWGIYFFYGGPTSGSGVASLGLGSFFCFFSFIVFFMV